jgi:hypothetical protein
MEEQLPQKAATNAEGKITLRQVHPLDSRSRHSILRIQAPYSVLVIHDHIEQLRSFQLRILQV